jgi:hypothetical protein
MFSVSHLRTEKDPVTEILCSLDFRMLGDGFLKVVNLFLYKLKRRSDIEEHLVSLREKCYEQVKEFH